VYGGTFNEVLIKQRRHNVVHFLIKGIEVCPSAVWDFLKILHNALPNINSESLCLCKNNNIVRGRLS